MGGGEERGEEGDSRGAVLREQQAPHVFAKRAESDKSLWKITQFDVCFLAGEFLRPVAAVGARPRVVLTGPPPFMCLPAALFTSSVTIKAGD